MRSAVASIAARGALPFATAVAPPLAAVAVGLAIGTGHETPAAALLIGAAMIALGLASWRWAVYGLLLYLPVSGVLILASYPHTVVSQSLKDVFFVLPAYLGFVAFAVSRRTRIAFDGAPVIALVMLSVLVGAQALNPSLPDPLVGVIGLKTWLFYIPLYFLGYHLIRHRRDLFFLLGLVAVGALLPAMIGIVEAAFIYAGRGAEVYKIYGAAAGPATQDFAQLETGAGALMRVPSTFAFVAQYYLFTVTMIAVVYAWWRGALSSRRLRSLGGLCWVLVLAAGFTSGQRSAFILIPVLIGLILFLEHGVHRVVTGLAKMAYPLGALLVAIFVSGISFEALFRHSSEVGRAEFHSVFLGGVENASAVTWIGLGAGIDTIASRHVVPADELFAPFGGIWEESWYAKTVLELGIPGLILLIAVLAAIIGRGLHAHVRLEDGRLRTISAALLAFLLWNVLYGMKGSPLDIDPVNIYFWLLAGVLAKLPLIDRTPVQRGQQEVST